MHHRSPAKIPQRVIDWWKSRSKDDTATGTPDRAGDSDIVTSFRDRAKDLGGRARNIAGSVQTRGKGAIEQVRRQEETGSTSGDVQQSAARIGSRVSSAATSAGTLAQSVVNKASERRTGPQTDTGEGDAGSSPMQAQAPAGLPAGSASVEPELSLDPSSVAWASTAGVIDPDIGNPSAFIEAEQGPAPLSTQDTGGPDTTPDDRASVTPDVDTTVMVSGNAEEGTRNETASAATQASTNTVEDKPVVQAPNDPTGGPEDRMPGTGSAEISSEPFAYSASGESTSGDRDHRTTSGDTPSRDPDPSAMSSGSPVSTPPGHAESRTPKIRFERRATDPVTTSQGQSAGSDDRGETTVSESTSAPAPVGDDGLPIYFDTDDERRPAAQSSDPGGLGTMDDDSIVPGETSHGYRNAVDAAMTSENRPSLGATTDDGSSITELEANTSDDDSSVQFPSTALSGDAYRSTTAPEAAVSGSEDAHQVRRPKPGSSIPNFATDADSPTRVVESPADSGDASTPATSQEVGSIVGEDPGEERQTGSGVTVSEPTSRVPGNAEPVPDPASGNARVGENTGRRGTSGLGAAGSGSSAGAGSFDDVQVADVVSSENSGIGMEAPDAVTQQDAAGAVDTKDPEGISRSITRDAASTNSESTSNTSSRGRSRRQRKSKSDERSGR